MLRQRARPLVLVVGLMTAVGAIGSVLLSTLASNGVSGSDVFTLVGKVGAAIVTNNGVWEIVGGLTGMMGVALGLLDHFDTRLVDNVITKELARQEAVPKDADPGDYDPPLTPNGQPGPGGIGAPVPKTVQDHLRIGEAQAIAGHYEEALAQFIAAAQRDPTSRTAWSNFALACGNLGKDPKKHADAIEMALQTCQRWLSQAPNDPRFLDAMAHVQRSKSEIEQALKFAQRACDVNPRNAYPWWTRGLLRCDLHQYEAAAQNFRNAVQRAPTAPTYRRDLVNALVATRTAKGYQEALGACDDLLQHLPRDGSTRASALALKANVLFRLKDYAQALSLCDEALTFEHELPAALWLRARVLRAQWKLGAARKAQRKARRLTSPPIGQQAA